MDAIIRNKKSLGILTLVLMVLAFFALAALPAAAQTETTLPAVQFGLIGMARAQTARLNVINLPPPDPEYPPNPCVVTLEFLNEQGEVFRDRAGNLVATRAELPPGESVFLELRAADALAGSTALRRPFRVQVERRSGVVEYPPNPCDGIVPTLEVYDNFTGRTMVFYESRPGLTQSRAADQ